LEPLPVLKSSVGAGVGADDDDEEAPGIVKIGCNILSASEFLIGNGGGIKCINFAFMIDCCSKTGTMWAMSLRRLPMSLTEAIQHSANAFSVFVLIVAEKENGPQTGEGEAVGRQGNATFFLVSPHVSPRCFQASLQSYIISSISQQVQYITFKTCWKSH
jgi:hypothetical protein